MGRRMVRVVIATVAFSGVFLGSVLASAASPAAPSCSTISIPVLDKYLGIDAKFVNPHRVSAKALICSYYGATGRAINEATIIYLASNSVEFAGNKTKNAATHTLQTVSPTEYAYSYGGAHYVFVLDGGFQVQLFAIVPLARIEHLARRLPVLP
jgi:hypothetical protein